MLRLRDALPYTAERMVRHEAMQVASGGKWHGRRCAFFGVVGIVWFGA